MSIATRPDGTITTCIGVSRSGKSVVVKRAAENDERVLAFDPKGEMFTQFGYERITSKEDLIKRCRQLAGAPGKLAFIASDPKSFDVWCACAFIWNMYAPITAIAEELARVTNPAKATGYWGRLTNQGLAYGITIYATVQRGQEVDKTVINNSTFVHICRHNTESDREYMANLLGIPHNLVPDKPLEFLQWTSDRGVVVQGTIDFPKSKTSKYWPEGTPRFRSKGGNRRVLTLGQAGMFKQVTYR